jgi:hypothetical protein
MNLRILKKLSKRAGSLLVQLDDHREQFAAAPFENYTSTARHDRKHWERQRSSHGETIRDRELKYRPRHGQGWISLSEPHHPMAGTTMVGAMSIGEEPEWSEETAWESLRGIVWWAVAEPNDLGAMKPTRSLADPAEVFALARELAGDSNGRRSRCRPA